MTHFYFGLRFEESLSWRSNHSREREREREKEGVRLAREEPGREEAPGRHSEAVAGSVLPNV
jgi:hypothetical protein